MKCEKCGTEYEGNYCPKGCNSPYYKKKKAKKPLFKRWWFWLIVVLVALYIIGSVGNTDEEQPDTPDQSVSQNDDNKDQTENKTEEPKDQTENKTENKEPVKNEELEKVPEKTPAQIKTEYISACESVTYKDIARYPDNYTGKNVKFRGKVIQVSEGGFLNPKNTYRIEVTEDEYGYWDDVVLVEYEVPEGAANILEDDIVTFYGECTGTTSYTSVLGSKITIPSVDAKYIDIE
ncbi:MAG: hypothetical protein IKM48_03340 [Clostridia bacterium]|nr:hypothetical protein [Clostridia bacterium]